MLIGAGMPNDGADGGGVGNPWDPVDQPSSEATSAGDEPYEEIIVGGRYRVVVPDGWEHAADGGGGVEFTSGANRMTASSIEVPPATLATDQLAALVKGQRKGFTGKIERPMDDSTADLQRASMAGTGTFKGKPATLLAELWIADAGSGLLITRILTAKPEAEVPEEAQQMVDELSQGF